MSDVLIKFLEQFPEGQQEEIAAALGNLARKIQAATRETLVNELLGKLQQPAKRGGARAQPPKSVQTGPRPWSDFPTEGTINKRDMLAFLPFGQEMLRVRIKKKAFPKDAGRNPKDVRELMYNVQDIREWYEKTYPNGVTA